MSKPKKIKVALALGSGGWRGLAHIGVIRSLLTHHIPIDIITGSSTGALMGGFFAATNDIDQVEQVMTEIKSSQVWSVFRDMSLRRSGLVKGKRYKDMIEKNVGKIKIEELDREYAALAVDFKNGKRVILDSGNLAAAIHASTAVPFIFEPVKVDGKQLIDGAVKTPVPVLLAKNMGADVVIAVNLYKNIFPLEPAHYNPLQVALRTTQLFLYQLAKQNCAMADITIWPEIVEPRKYSIFGNIVGNKQVTVIGEAAADAQITNIKKLIKKAVANA
jgi:NTE family protein